LESFESKEIRMLIIKEGLTDPCENVKSACYAFLKQTVSSEENKNDLCKIFKLIDCNKILVSQYYVQLSLLICNLIFNVVPYPEIGMFLEKILLKLKKAAGIAPENESSLQDEMIIDTGSQEILFEEMLFLRIICEFTKMQRVEK
jgi:hypothetical protein